MPPLRPHSECLLGDLEANTGGLMVSFIALKIDISVYW